MYEAKISYEVQFGCESKVSSLLNSDVWLSRIKDQLCKSGNNGMTAVS